MEGGEGSSGGGDNTERKYPLGFRFKPTDEELVEYYLLPKLQGKPTVPNDAVIEADVYECDPEILINQRYKDTGEDNHWYFLSPRTRKYRNGIRPSRRTADDRGRWKPSSGKEKKGPEAAVTEKLCSDGTVKYCLTKLAYHAGPPNGEEKTKWLMHEFTVPEYEVKSGGGDSSMVLDKYALYKIYISPLTRYYTDEDGDTSAAREEAGSSSSKPGAPAPESGRGTSAPPTLSNKKAGKRPAGKQQPLDRATETKRARQPTLAPGGLPAPMHGNGGVGMGAPLRVGAAGYSYVPGLQAQVPWPPVTCNRLQGPVQLPQRMYQHNGQPVAAPYHGQGQAPMHPSSSVSAHNDNSLGRTMVMRPPPPPSGFGQTMLRPQTLPPPSAAQPLRQLTDADLNDPYSQRVISQLLAALKAPEARHLFTAPCAVPQQFPTASNLPPPQQQQPTFDAGANHPARDDATVPRPGIGSQQHHQQPQPQPQPQPQQSSSAIPATSVSGPGGAAAPAEATPPYDIASSELPVRGDADGGSGMEALDSNSDKLFADLAAMTTLPSGPWMGGR